MAERSERSERDAIPELLDVLVVGAGPTGLVLALWLTRMGVRVRIVDRAPRAGTTSRALAIHARTLELYEALDLAQPLVAAGVHAHGANLWARGRRMGHIELLAGNRVSRYPYMLTYPQDKHEQFLEDRLAAAGVCVERNTEVIDIAGDIVTIADQHGRPEQIKARYICGCDGPKSIVREALGATFDGKTYEHMFYVADVEAHGPPIDGEIHIAFDDADFLVSFPLDERHGEHGHVRLIGDVEVGADAKTDPTWGDVHHRVIERLGIAVDRVNWFSTYRVHHRVASTFGDGRLFVLGDAAHVHSPVGGQGMNTGIGDAVNLAWKLAAVIHGHAPRALLDTYAAERMPFAKKLVATTDRAFELVTDDGAIARTIRNDVMPRLMRRLMKLDVARRFAFRVLSQIEIAYPDSPLSEGRAGRVAGGDRLPWSKFQDNFAPLRALAWQVHTYGMPSPELRVQCAALRLPLQVFHYDDDSQAAGLAWRAAYVVRPDGYVALATRTPSDIADYFQSRAIFPEASLDGIDYGLTFDLTSIAAPSSF